MLWSLIKYGSMVSQPYCGGKKSEHIILAAHGSHSSKIDDCIWVLAEEALKQGYHVISFDLPQHGERVYESGRIMPDKCVNDLKAMYTYALENSKAVSLFGCSIGAYYELLTFADAEIDQVWFLSPVTDMERIIHNLLDCCHVSEDDFRKCITIRNDTEELYYPYYEYVHTHPIICWPHKTAILRGENDTLCESACIQEFSQRFNCELTEQKGGEHWFHTDAELEFFRVWLRARLR
jgi:surfactin synthase thioesterase subunit